MMSEYTVVEDMFVRHCSRLVYLNQSIKGVVNTPALPSPAANNNTYMSLHTCNHFKACSVLLPCCCLKVLWL